MCATLVCSVPTVILTCFTLVFYDIHILRYGHNGSNVSSLPVALREYPLEKYK